MSRLTHVDESGKARMVDVSDKPVTSRTAKATGSVICKDSTLKRVQEGSTPKGAVIATAELAGVMAAKRTAELIPLCHPLPLTKIGVRISVDEDLPGFRIEAEVRTNAATGVEMEALTAVTISALTLFDMLKGIDREIRIEAVQVTSKSGGQSGSWIR